MAVLRGFSLIEMLVVLAVIALMAVLTLPAANRLIDAHSLRATADRVSALVERGRVEAAIKQQAVAVRFYQSEDPNLFTAAQLFTLSAAPNTTNGTVATNVLSPLFRFDERVVLRADLSGALTNTLSRRGLHQWPGGASAPYWEFLVFPSGNLSLAESHPAPFLTLTGRSHRPGQTSPPKNPLILSLDTLTGRVTVFQR